MRLRVTPQAAANASRRVSFGTALWRLRLKWREPFNLCVKTAEILTLFPRLCTVHAVSPAPSRFTLVDFWSALSSILHQTTHASCLSVFAWWRSKIRAQRPEPQQTVGWSENDLSGDLVILMIQKIKVFIFFSIKAIIFFKLITFTFITYNKHYSYFSGLLGPLFSVLTCGHCQVLKNLM